MKNNNISYKEILLDVRQSPSFKLLLIICFVILYFEPGIIIVHWQKRRFLPEEGKQLTETSSPWLQ